MRNLKTLIEAAYRLDLSPCQCVEELARVAGKVLEQRRPVAAWAFEISDEGIANTPTVASNDDSLAVLITMASRLFRPQQHQLIRLGSPAYASMSELFARSHVLASMKTAGHPEFAGLLCPTGIGTGVGVGASYDAPIRIGPSHQSRWGPVAAHISAAWRLRDILAAGSRADFTFSPGGHLLEHGSDPPSEALHALLRQAVLRREQQRVHNDDTEIWPALVAGEWTIIDRFEPGGQRWVVVHHNAPSSVPFRALSTLELQALEMALDGVAGKVIACDLRVSEATASRLVTRSLHRLGLRSLTEAAELREAAAMQFRLESRGAAVELAAVAVRPPLGDPASSLTTAERAVLACVLEGQSDHQIAEARRTSPRTIANQIGQLFAKLGVRSRRELIIKMMRPLSSQPR
jgi:DNA-binding NarL/FixJ family response regulator